MDKTSACCPICESILQRNGSKQHKDRSYHCDYCGYPGYDIGDGRAVFIEDCRAMCGSLELRTSDVQVAIIRELRRNNRLQENNIEKQREIINHLYRVENVLRFAIENIADQIQNEPTSVTDSNVLARPVTSLGNRLQVFNLIRKGSRKAWIDHIWYGEGHICGWRRLPIINTIGDLLQWSKDDLTIMDNVGDKTIQYIEECLAKLKLKLRKPKKRNKKK